MKYFVYPFPFLLWHAAGTFIKHLKQYLNDSVAKRVLFSIVPQSQSIVKPTKAPIVLKPRF